MSSFAPPTANAMAGGPPLGGAPPMGVPPAGMKMDRPSAAENPFRSGVLRNRKNVYATTSYFSPGSMSNAPPFAGPGAPSSLSPKPANGSSQFFQQPASTKSSSLPLDANDGVRMNPLPGTSSLFPEPASANQPNNMNFPQQNEAFMAPPSHNNQPIGAPAQLFPTRSPNAQNSQYPYHNTMPQQSAPLQSPETSVPGDRPADIFTEPVPMPKATQGSMEFFNTNNNQKGNVADNSQSRMMSNFDDINLEQETPQHLFYENRTQNILEKMPAQVGFSSSPSLNSQNSDSHRPSDVVQGDWNHGDNNAFKAEASEGTNEEYSDHEGDETSDDSGDYTDDSDVETTDEDHHFGESPNGPFGVPAPNHVPAFPPAHCDPPYPHESDPAVGIGSNTTTASSTGQFFDSFSQGVAPTAEPIGTGPIITGSNISHNVMDTFSKGETHATDFFSSLSSNDKSHTNANSISHLFGAPQVAAPPPEAVPPSIASKELFNANDRPLVSDVDNNMLHDNYPHHSRDDAAKAALPLSDPFAPSNQTGSEVVLSHYEAGQSDTTATVPANEMQYSGTLSPSHHSAFTPVGQFALKQQSQSNLNNPGDASLANQMEAMTFSGNVDPSNSPVTQTMTEQPNAMSSPVASAQTMFQSSASVNTSGSLMHNSPTAFHHPIQSGISAVGHSAAPMNPSFPAAVNFERENHESHSSQNPVEVGDANHEISSENLVAALQDAHHPAQIRLDPSNQIPPPASGLQANVADILGSNSSDMQMNRQFAPPSSVPSQQFPISATERPNPLGISDGLSRLQQPDNATTQQQQEGKQQDHSGATHFPDKPALQPASTDGWLQQQHQETPTHQQTQEHIQHIKHLTSLSDHQHSIPAKDIITSQPQPPNQEASYVPQSPQRLTAQQPQQQNQGVHTQPDQQHQQSHGHHQQPMQQFEPQQPTIQQQQPLPQPGHHHHQQPQFRRTSEQPQPGQQQQLRQHFEQPQPQQGQQQQPEPRQQFEQPQPQQEQQQQHPEPRQQFEPPKQLPQPSPPHQQRQPQQIQQQFNTPQEPQQPQPLPLPLQQQQQFQPPQAQEEQYPSQHQQHEPQRQPFSRPQQQQQIHQAQPQQQFQQGSFQQQPPPPPNYQRSRSEEQHALQRQPQQQQLHGNQHYVSSDLTSQPVHLPSQHVHEPSQHAPVQKKQSIPSQGQPPLQQAQSMQGSSHQQPHFDRQLPVFHQQPVPSAAIDRPVPTNQPPTHLQGHSATQQKHDQRIAQGNPQHQEPLSSSLFYQPTANEPASRQSGHTETSTWQQPMSRDLPASSSSGIPYNAAQSASGHFPERQQQQHISNDTAGYDSRQISDWSQPKIEERQMAPASGPPYGVVSSSSNQFHEQPPHQQIRRDPPGYGSRYPEQSHPPPHNDNANFPSSAHNQHGDAYNPNSSQPWNQPPASSHSTPMEVPHRGQQSQDWMQNQQNYPNYTPNSYDPYYNYYYSYPGYYQQWQQYYGYGNQGWDDSSVHSASSYAGSQTGSEYDADSRPPSVQEVSSPLYEDELSMYDVSAKDIMAMEREAEEPPIMERLTPLHFLKAHLVARFSSSGAFTVAEASNPRDGVKAKVNFVPLKVIADLSDLIKFPGPLIAGETSKKSIIKFAKRKVEFYQGCTHLSKDNAQDHALLWDYISILTRHNGRIDGSDVAEMLVHYSKNSGHHFRSGRNSATTPTHPDSTASKVDHFRETLYQGCRKEALEFSAAEGLWGHALVLSHLLDPKIHQAIVARFLSSLDSADPLLSLYSHLAQKGGHNHDGDWRLQLAMFIANPSKAMMNDRQSMAKLGDSLANEGKTAAAHLVYLLANVKFGDHRDKATKFCLLSGDHTHSQSATRPDLWATNEMIQLTEIFEYLCCFQNERASIPSFQYFKYIYATRLAEAGMLPEAFSYLELVSDAIIFDPRAYDAQLIRAVEKFAGIIFFRAVDSMDDEQPQWMEKLGQIAQDKEESQAVPSPRMHGHDQEEQLRSSSFASQQGSLGQLSSNDRLVDDSPRTDHPAISERQNSQQHHETEEAADMKQGSLLHDHHPPPNVDQHEQQEAFDNDGYAPVEQPSQQLAPVPMFNPASVTMGELGVYGEQDRLSQSAGRPPALSRKESSMSSVSVSTYQSSTFQERPVNMEAHGDGGFSNVEYTQQPVTAPTSYYDHGNQQKSQINVQGEDAFNQSYSGGQGYTPSPYDYQQQQQPRQNPYGNMPSQAQSQGPYVRQEGDDEEEEDLFNFMASKAKKQNSHDQADGVGRQNVSVTSSPKGGGQQTDPKANGEQGAEGEKGWFGGLFSRFRKGGPKEAYLPPDKEKSIVYDKELGKWIDKNAPPESNSPPPPPPMGGMGSSPVPGTLLSKAMTAQPNPNLSLTGSEDGADGPPAPPSRFSRKAAAANQGRRGPRYVDALGGTKVSGPAIGGLMAPMPLGAPAQAPIFNPQGMEQQSHDNGPGMQQNDDGRNDGQPNANVQPPVFFNPNQLQQTPGTERRRQQRYPR